MVITASQSIYQPGDSFLYHVDPRLKVLVCFLSVVLAFAATGYVQLLVVLLPIAFVLLQRPHSSAPGWRVLWLLRWLLLFTLLLHLLFSPGRTLWGLSWLSLDGLLRGLFVCAQLSLAVASAILLSVTTTTDALTRTFGWFVTPLRWLGFDTKEWQKTLLLTMNFLPVVHEEIMASSTSDPVQPAEAVLKNDSGLCKKAAKKLNDLLLRLLNRGDMVAHQIALDDYELKAQELPPLLPMVLHDRIFTFGAAMVVACYWFVG